MDTEIDIDVDIDIDIDVGIDNYSIIYRERARLCCAALRYALAPAVPEVRFAKQSKQGLIASAGCWV